MSVPACFPYRSAAARDSFFAYYDSLAAKQWPVASETRMVPTSYGDTFVRITGPADAPPLVLLPGAATTSIMWAPNIRALSEVCRTFSVDQLGDVGRTTCIQPVEHVTDLLAWLDELFDGLKLKDRINLVGISYGGWLAAEYARHAPQRLTTAVLLAPGNTVLRVSNQFIVRIALAAIAPRTFLRPFALWMFRDQVRKHPDWLDPWLELALNTMKSVDRRLPMPSVWSDAEWSGLSVPALFLAGEHEVIYDPGKAVRRLNRVAPHVTAKIIPGAGHDLTLVQPEMVDQRILEFVKQRVAVPETIGTGVR